MFERVLRRERVSNQDFHRALREADCELDEMESAILEVDGHISIARKSGA